MTWQPGPAVSVFAAGLFEGSDRDRDRRPTSTPGCTTWSSSGVASAGCSPPAPSSGPRCGSPSSTGPTTISSSPCCTRWPPGSSRRARSPPPSATSCGTIRPLRTILGEVEHVDVEARQIHVDEFGKPLTIAHARPHRRRRCFELLLRSRRIPSGSVRHEVVDDALALRGNIFGSFELAEAEEGPGEAPPPHDVRPWSWAYPQGRRSRRSWRSLPGGHPPQLPHDRPGWLMVSSWWRAWTSSSDPWGPTCRG